MAMKMASLVSRLASLRCRTNVAVEAWANWHLPDDCEFTQVSEIVESLVESAQWLIKREGDLGVISGLIQEIETQVRFLHAELERSVSEVLNAD